MSKLRKRDRPAAIVDVWLEDADLGDRLVSKGDAANDPTLVGQAVRAYRRALRRGPADDVTTMIRLGGALTLLCQLEPGAASPRVAVRTLRSALKCVRSGTDPRWLPIAHLSLAKATRLLFEESGSRRHLISSIASYRLAAEGVRNARAPRDLADATVNLANALTTLTEQSGSPSGALEAAALYRDAIGRLTGKRSGLDRANTWVALGNTLLVLADVSGDRLFAERALTALRFGRRAINRQEAPQDWAEAWERTAAAYLTLGEMTDRAASFASAVAAYRQLLDAPDLGPGSGQWANLKIGLGASLLALGEALGETRIVREAAGELRHAVAALSQGGPSLELAVAESHLGNALLAYSEQSADADAAREAALAFRRALPVLLQAGDIFELSKIRTNLANTLMVTGERSVGRGELQEAVALYRLALSAFSKRKMPAAWATGEMNLGSAMAMLGDRTRDVALITEAIVHLQLALGRRTQALLPASWAKTTLNLANALLSIAGIKSDAEKAGEAAALYRTLMKFRSRKGMAVNRAKTAENLGSALALRGELLGDPPSLRAAVKAYKRAEREMPQHRLPWAWAHVKLNCGNALTTLGGLTRSETELVAGIESYRSALSEMYLERDPNAWSSVEGNLGRALRTRASLFPGKEAIADAVTHEERFLRNASMLLWTAGNDEEQPVWAERITSSALRLTDMLLTVNRNAEAFAAIQRASAIQLSVAMSVSGKGLEEDQSGNRLLRARWRDACDAANRLDTQLLSVTEGVELRKLLEDRAGAQHLVVRRFAALGRAVRETGMRSPEPVSCADVRAALPEGGAAVLLAAGLECLTAFVISDAGAAGQVMCMRLEGFPASELERLVGLRRTPVQDSDRGGTSWLEAYARFRNAVDVDGRVAPSDIADWNAAIERVSEHLWGACMGPLHNFLLGAAGVVPGSEILLIPSGLIALLPLHAARRGLGDGVRYFIEDWTVTYAPSAAAWLTSRTRSLEPRRRGRRLLAVTPVGINPALEAFRGYEPIELSGKAASARAVRGALPSANYVSLYCHGSWNAADPMRSALHLTAPAGTTSEVSRPDDLTVRDMRDTGLGSSRLAMLLACESGMIGLRQTHEAIGFPAALIDAGAPGVLASLWMVEQKATASLVKNLLAAHLRPENPLSPAAALRHAQLRMLAADRDHLLADTGGDRPDTAAGDVRVQLAGGIGARRSHGPSSTRQPELRPSAPFYWAGFTLAGA